MIENNKNKVPRPGLTVADLDIDQAVILAKSLFPVEPQVVI